jgi:hypothetical protein
MATPSSIVNNVIMNVDQSPTFPELPGVRKPAQMQGFLLPAS